MSEDIHIVVPEAADGELYELSCYLAKKLNLDGGYGLGGENGYGVEFENEVFMMHPFCWCEQETCPWCEDDAPNFLFKPTGARVWWYKWIGRDERLEGKLPKNWLEVCKRSVREAL